MLFIYPNIFQSTILKMENIIGYVVPLWYAFFFTRALCIKPFARYVYTRNTRTHTHTHTTRLHVHVQARIYVGAHVTRRVLIPENGKSLSIFHGLFKPKTKSFSNFHGIFTHLVRLVVSCESDIMN